MRSFARPIRVTPEIEVSSVWSVPEDYRPGRDTGIILAHGAGTDMEHPFMVHVHEGLAAQGHLVVRFNFPYMERGRRPPDRPPLLKDTWRAVIERVRGDDAVAPGRLILAGKSLGGRMASELVAEGAECAGLVLLGYPLHPPRRPERPRTAHLADIRVPMLFVQGTRDELCDLSRLRRLLHGLPAQTSLHIIEEGDHSFKVPKRQRRAEHEIWDDIVALVGDWLAHGPLRRP